LEKTISKSVKSDTRQEKSRSAEDMLRELLELTGYIERNIPESHGLRIQTEPTPEMTDLWHKLLDRVGRVSPFTRSYLLEAIGSKFSDNKLTILFPPDFEGIELVKNARNMKLLQKHISELGGGANCAVEFLQLPPPSTKTK
jgi:hypothetical protein